MFRNARLYMIFSSSLHFMVTGISFSDYAYITITPFESLLHGTSPRFGHVILHFSHRHFRTRVCTRTPHRIIASDFCTSTSHTLAFDYHRRLYLCALARIARQGPLIRSSPTFYILYPIVSVLPFCSLSLSPYSFFELRFPPRSWCFG